jgi:CheY-like chemotaxis protein
MTRHTILVIEDNPLNMKLARVLLDLAHYSVLEAPDAEQGILMAREHGPDLILMDLQLPGMDGFEATRIIRREEMKTGRHTPIVAMSAHSMNEENDRCLDAGMDDCLAKPIQVNLLREVIEQQLAGGPRPEASAEQQATHSMSDSEVFDREDLLRNFGGDEECLVRFVDMFINALPAQIGCLQEVIAAGRPPEVQAWAHKIKGAATSMRAQSIGRILAGMERSAAQDDMDQVRRLMMELQNAFETFRNHFPQRAVDGVPNG